MQRHRGVKANLKICQLETAVHANYATHCRSHARRHGHAQAMRGGGNSVVTWRKRCAQRLRAAAGASLASRRNARATPGMSTPAPSRTAGARSTMLCSRFDPAGAVQHECTRVSRVAAGTGLKSRRLRLPPVELRKHRATASVKDVRWQQAVANCCESLRHGSFIR